MTGKQKVGLAELARKPLPGNADDAGLGLSESTVAGVAVPPKAAKLDVCSTKKLKAALLAPSASQLRIRPVERQSGLTS